jgi:hypothetical protein
MAKQVSPQKTSAFALVQQGTELLRSGSPAGALAIFQNVQETLSDNYAFCVNLAQCLKRLGRWPEAIRQFENAFELRRTRQIRIDGSGTREAIGTYQLSHLVEQLGYLSKTNQAQWLNGHDQQALVRLRDFMSNAYGLLGRAPLPSVPPEIANLIIGCPHRDVPPPGLIINAGAMIRTLKAGPLGDSIYIVDDIFDQATLSALRLFLTNSTIWFDAHAEGGYLGAHLHDGLASDLIRDVAIAIREFAHHLVGPSLISQVWAFKYANVAHGIDVHADQADINVNIWLTDEQFNSVQGTGGMTIYGARVPENWTFKAYNASPDLVRNHLATTGALAHKIAYRANRATIFPSRLFHHTDPVTFGGGYGGRRVNLTIMLDRATSRHS